MAAPQADPFSAFAGSFGAGLGQGVGDALGGPKGPLISGSGAFDLRGFLDGSGWTVSTGSSKATGATRTQTGDPWGAPAGSGAGQAGLPWYIGLPLAAGFAWFLWKQL